MGVSQKTSIETKRLFRVPGKENTFCFQTWQIGRAFEKGGGFHPFDHPDMLRRTACRAAMGRVGPKVLKRGWWPCVARGDCECHFWA